MKVVIAGGKEEADYIIKMYKNFKNKLVIINPDLEVASFLGARNEIDVIHGDPTSEYILSISGIEKADLFLALSPLDIDNYVSCKLAKLLFGVKKTIAIVKNPANVSLFKSLGVDSAVCSTYLLGEYIKQEASVEDLVKSLSFEEEKVQMFELSVKANHLIAGKEIKDIVSPVPFNISAIFRKPQVIIPKGNSKILEGDKIFVLASSDDKEAVSRLLTAKAK